MASASSFSSAAKAVAQADDIRFERVNPIKAGIANGTYQVSAEVENMLTLQSYTDTLISMSLVMGVIFELPIVCAILGRMHLISSSLMSRYRRHAIVAILVIAAIITPTTDIFTLLIVSLPIWLLYEFSILVVKLIR